MSNRNPRERFDYKSWFERNVAKRTVAALEARDAAFAEKHADTPLAHLAQYVSNRAELLRHTPSPCEIDGGTFIEERFGGWAAVLEMAHLAPTGERAQVERHRTLQAGKSRAGAAVLRGIRAQEEGETRQGRSQPCGAAITAEREKAAGAGKERGS